jgi:hypothetical protein
MTASHADSQAVSEERVVKPDVVAHGSQPSTRTRWWGRILSGLAVVFLLFDAAVKLLELPVAVEATTQLGYPESVMIPLGLIEVACSIVYLVPRASVLGAILWTGVPGRRGRDACARREPALQPGALPDLRRGAPLGRPLAA